jgi:hypothetical protein
MTAEQKHASRRTLLVGALTAAPLIAATGPALAAGTLPQSSAKYQDTPKGANRCDTCVYYISGAKADTPGQCKIVAGQVSPHGWCVLFAPKAG